MASRICCSQRNIVRDRWTNSNNIDVLIIVGWYSVKICNRQWNFNPTVYLDRGSRDSLTVREESFTTVLYTTTCYAVDWKTIRMVVTTMMRMMKWRSVWMLSTQTTKLLNLTNQAAILIDSLLLSSFIYCQLFTPCSLWSRLTNSSKCITNHSHSVVHHSLLYHILCRCVCGPAITNNVCQSPSDG